MRGRRPPPGAVAPRAGPRARELAALASILALAAGLGFAHLGRRSLWFDEAFSVHLARLPAGEMIDRLVHREANMSLYYVLLRGWTAFGEDEVAVRSLSVVLGIGAVAAVWLLGRRLFGPVAGVTAAFLLATNAFFLRYAQEARGYTLAILLVTAAALALCRLLERSSWRAAVAYALTAGLALYAHFFAALALAGQALSLPALRSRGWSRKHVAAGFAGAALIGTPLLAFVLRQDAGQVSWIAPPTPRDLVELARSLVGGSRPLLAVYGAATLAAVAAGLRRPPASRTAPPGAVARGAGEPLPERWVVALLVGWLAIPPLAAYAISVAKPLFVDRYLLVCLPALVVLAGAGLARLPRPWGYAAALVVVGFFSARSVLWQVEHGFGEPWRAVTRHVLENAREADGLAFYIGALHIPYDYYARRSPAGGRTPRIVFPVPGDEGEGPSRARLRELASPPGRLWLVLGHHGTPARAPVTGEIELALSRTRCLSGARRFGPIEVRLYVPDATSPACTS